jgi:hypothetical protein
MLLQVLYRVRPDRMLIEQIQYNILFRWFVGLAIDDAVWVPTVFIKNRQRLIEHDVVVELFNQILAQADVQDLLSGEHFSVDGILIEAWTGHKSFAPKDVKDGANFRNQRRNNKTRPTNQARTVMLGCTAKARPPANCASWATH